MEKLTESEEHYVSTLERALEDEGCAATFGPNHVHFLIQLVRKYTEKHDAGKMSFEEAARLCEEAQDRAVSGVLRPRPLVHEGARTYVADRPSRSTFQFGLEDFVITPSGRVGEVVGLLDDTALVKLGEGDCATHSYSVDSLKKFKSTTSV